MIALVLPCTVFLIDRTSNRKKTKAKRTKSPQSKSPQSKPLTAATAAAISKYPEKHHSMSTFLGQVFEDKEVGEQISQTLLLFEDDKKDGPIRKKKDFVHGENVMELGAQIEAIRKEKEKAEEAEKTSFAAAIKDLTDAFEGPRRKRMKKKRSPDVGSKSDSGDELEKKSKNCEGPGIRTCGNCSKLEPTKKAFKKCQK